VTTSRNFTGVNRPELSRVNLLKHRVKEAVMNARIILGASVVAVAAVAGCGGGATHNAAKIAPAGSGGKSPDRVVATSTETSATGCLTKNLSFSIGTPDGTAGSVYEPLRLTNKGSTTCTLFGYPGVSFVTAGSGDQVGADASRNPQHSAVTVTLASGATAESIVQVVDHMNYSPSQCKAADVSGFRVYPPGETSAAYVPFDHASSACSTDVTQLTVEAVAAAS
jgi:hypothetical protein